MYLQGSRQVGRRVYYFGVQRPSLARTPGELIREGVVSLHKRELKVLDRKKLEELF